MVFAGDASILSLQHTVEDRDGEEEKREKGEEEEEPL